MYLDVSTYNFIPNLNKQYMYAHYLCINSIYGLDGLEYMYLLNIFVLILSRPTLVEISVSLDATVVIGMKMLLYKTDSMIFLI